MRIKFLSVANFKSFRAFRVAFQKLNILIGANSAGKSNFLQILKFLRDIAKEGLPNAVSMQGGTDYIRNLHLSSKEPLEICLTLVQPLRLFDRANRLEAASHEQTYSLKIGFGKNNCGYRILHEELELAGTFENRPFTLRIKNEQGKLLAEKSEDSETPFDALGMLTLPADERLGENEALLLSENSLLGIYPLFGSALRQFAFYDFDPKMTKKAVPLIGKSELEADGSNLALVLKNILSDKDRKAEFLTLVQELLPFIESFEAERLSDNLLYLQMRETRNKSVPIPAAFISDGTLNITALLIALYFERKSVLILEEPERNIHPFLISRLVEMMHDASEQKQIFLTTHHPEIVRFGGAKNLLLISRDAKNFSILSHPSQKEEIKTFLKNEIGIEELYIQDLLGI